MSGVLIQRETIEGEDSVVVAPAPAPRMPVKSKRFTLGNGYEMFWVEVRTNVSRTVIRDLQSGDNDRYIGAVAQFITAWNVADEDGNPLPCDLATLDSQPNELIGEIFNGFIELFTKETTVPKERDAASASGSKANDEE